MSFRTGSSSANASRGKLDRRRFSRCCTTGTSSAGILDRCAPNLPEQAITAKLQRGLLDSSLTCGPEIRLIHKRDYPRQMPVWPPDASQVGDEWILAHIALTNHRTKEH